MDRTRPSEGGKDQGGMPVDKKKVRKDKEPKGRKRYEGRRLGHRGV